MSSTRPVALTVAAITLALAGCGGTSSSTKSSSQAAASPQATSTSSPVPVANGKPLTRTALVAQANAICSGIVAQLDAHTFKTTQDLVRIAPALAAYEHGALAELRALKPPASLARDWPRVVASVRIIADNTGKLAQLMQSSPNGAQAASALSQQNYKVRAPLLATAARDGFGNCAKVL